MREVYVDGKKYILTKSEYCSECHMGPDCTYPGGPDACFKNVQKLGDLRVLKEIK